MNRTLVSANVDCSCADATDNGSMSVYQYGYGANCISYVDWITAGDNITWNAPDGWTLAGSGVSVAREASIIKHGTYSAKVTRAGTNGCLESNLTVAKWSELSSVRGRTLTFSCLVYATVANRARILLQDIGTGGNAAYSSYHTGDSTWQLLTVSNDISVDCTDIYTQLRVDTGDTSAYFDGAMLVEGSSAFAFADKPAGEGVWADYSATSTIVGFSGSPTKSIYIKKMGKTVFVFAHIYGTSNSTTTSFTVPYNASAVPGAQVSRVINATDNTSTDVISAETFISSNSNIVTIYRDKAGTNWTNSGEKAIKVQFFYEAAN